MKQKNEIKNIDCELVNEAKAMHLSKLVTTMFILDCSSFRIQISIFYKRGEFYWIGDDETKNSTPEFFNDYSRAMNE